MKLADKTHYFLLERRPDEGRYYVTGYRRDELERANEHYFTTEATIAEIPGGDATLVSVDSLEALKRAYPNYSLDTRAFLRELRRVLRVA